MKIIFTLKSGNLSEEEVCYELIKPKETIDIKCIATEYEEYEVEKPSSIVTPSSGIIIPDGIVTC